MHNTVAVLIPTKNRRALLEEAIQSVFNQTVLPDELIIVNDGSTDDTAQFLDTLKNGHRGVRISVITRVKSGGVNTARNEGIKIIQSKWIMFLDDDDTLVPEAVGIVKAKTASLDETFGMIFFNTYIRSEKGEYVGGFQFDGQNFYDPTYKEVMVKFGLKGDCKPVFLRSIFASDRYWFPSNVNGFESVIIRKIAHDGFRIRYYKDISTIINQYNNTEHLSFSAPAKNPGAYLSVHKEDLVYHKKFYNNNRRVLADKYREMSKLAFRNKNYIACSMYLCLSMINTFL